MPNVDFQNVPDPEPGEGKTMFEPLPDGQYKAFIKEVREKQGPKGMYFSIEWMITDGEFRGRKIWGSIFFTIPSLPRLKIMISRLGFDVSHPMDVTSEVLTGKQAWITLELKSYRNNNGDEVRTNKITYAGFDPIGEGAVDNPGEEDDGDLPV